MTLELRFEKLGIMLPAPVLLADIRHPDRFEQVVAHCDRLQLCNRSSPHREKPVAAEQPAAELLDLFDPSARNSRENNPMSPRNQ